MKRNIPTHRIDTACLLIAALAALWLAALIARQAIAADPYPAICAGYETECAARVVEGW